MVKILIYVLILLTFVQKVFAQDSYFYLVPETYVSRKDGNINFNLNYNFDPDLLKEFYIKPVSSYKNTEIFNKKLNVWVSENDLLTRMPDLKEKISIHFKSFPKETVEIHFKVYRYKTSAVFETLPIKIWGPKSLANYKEHFNESLHFSEDLNKMDEEVNPTNLVQTKNSKEISEIQPAKKYAPIALLFFIVSAVVGFFTKRVLHGHSFGNLVKLHNAFD